MQNLDHIVQLLVSKGNVEGYVAAAILRYAMQNGGAEFREDGSLQLNVPMQHWELLASVPVRQELSKAGLDNVSFTQIAVA